MGKPRGRGETKGGAMEVEEQRREIWSLLAGGLPTEAFPRADTHEQVLAIIQRLREGPPDLKSKLVISGFTLTPVQHEGMNQICRTCMYYHSRRRHCVLPELDLPAEPQWSCRLWRI
jgi:hypothetical protein